MMSQIILGVTLAIDLYVGFGRERRSPGASEGFLTKRVRGGVSLLTRIGLRP